MPTGCSVPNVPLGLKTPSASIEPSSALNSVSAFGLAMENGASVSAPSTDAEGRVKFSVTVVSSTASQLAKRLWPRASFSFVFLA